MPVEVNSPNALDPTGPTVPANTIESSKPGATASDSVLVGEGPLVAKPRRRRERSHDPQMTPPFCCTVSGCSFNALSSAGDAPGEELLKHLNFHVQVEGFNPSLPRFIDNNILWRFFWCANCGGLKTENEKCQNCGQARNAEERPRRFKIRRLSPHLSTFCTKTRKSSKKKSPESHKPPRKTAKSNPQKRKDDSKTKETPLKQCKSYPRHTRHCATLQRGS